MSVDQIIPPTVSFSLPLPLFLPLQASSVYPSLPIFSQLLPSPPLPSLLPATSPAAEGEEVFDRPTELPISGDSKDGFYKLGIPRRLADLRRFSSSASPPCPIGRTDGRTSISLPIERRSRWQTRPRPSTWILTFSLPLPHGRNLCYYQKHCCCEHLSDCSWLFLRDRVGYIKYCRVLTTADADGEGGEAGGISADDDRLRGRLNGGARSSSFGPASYVEGDQAARLRSSFPEKIPERR